MGKKKAPVALEAWCWYCDREFEDEKVLISHQRAKHFRCPQCPRRLNTAGGLGVHLEQVHKSELTTLENTLPGRNTLELEIYGMEGVPEQDLLEWERRKTTRTQGQAQVSKKPRIHKGVLTVETLKHQLDAFRRLRQVGPARPAGETAASALVGAPHPRPPPRAIVAPHLQAQRDGLKQRLVYSETHLNPDEKLAREPEYAYVDPDEEYDTGAPRPGDGVGRSVPSTWGKPALGLPGLPPRPNVPLPPPTEEYTPHQPLLPDLLVSVDPLDGPPKKRAGSSPPKIAGTKRARADDLF